VNLALGRAGVTLGLAAAVLGVITVGYGLIRKRPDLVRLSRWYAALVFLGGFVAACAMESALITRDFTVKYVAENGSTKTPALYNFATMWGALEGSIILWALILGGYLVAVVLKFRKRLADPLVGWAVLTMLIVCVFFFGLMAGPANPFTGFSPPAGFDGPGPNPLLQNNLLMAFHPPMLYLGYVGFTVPFAFAMAALITGRVGEGWLLATRRWTLIAWGFLTVGIILGSWWSYEVLGWGGLLGLGPRRKRVVAPVAHRYRVFTLGLGARTTWHVAGVEHLAVVRDICAHNSRHVDYSFRSARVSARIYNVQYWNRSHQFLCTHCFLHGGTHRLAR